MSDPARTHRTWRNVLQAVAPGAVPDAALEQCIADHDTTAVAGPRGLASGNVVSTRRRRGVAATSPRPGRDLAATRPRPRRDVAASAAVAQPCPQSQATFLNNTKKGRKHPHGTYRTVSPTELDGMLKMARGLDAEFLGGTYAAAAQRIGCNTTRAARRRFV